MRRRVFAVLAATVAFGALTAPPVSAHHSFAAAFDANALITVQGVITQVKLANPHSWIYLDVKDANGNVVQWGFEAQTPTALIRSGVKPDVFRVGSTVTHNLRVGRGTTRSWGITSASTRWRTWLRSRGPASVRSRRTSSRPRSSRSGLPRLGEADRACSTKIGAWSHSLSSASAAVATESWPLTRCGRPIPTAPVAGTSAGLRSTPSVRTNAV